MALGLPSISIKFIQEGITAISRGSRGIVAMIIKEEKAISPATIVDVTDIPSDVTDNNKQLITIDGRRCARRQSRQVSGHYQATAGKGAVLQHAVFRHAGVSRAVPALHGIAAVPR